MEITMAIIAPFNGLRFNTDVVGDLAAVTAPPYDIISPAQQKELYEAHPFNVIRLENGEEFPDDDDNHNKYTRSAEFLEDWMQSEVLRQDFAPSLYIYGQKFTLKDGRTLSYKGIMCLVHLEEFEKKIILPHEETLSKAKTDRLNLMRATGANFSPIYSLFNDNSGTVSEIIRKASADEPQNCFVSADKVTQSLWQISDGETIARVKEAFASKQLFIADGHHRYETALNFRNEMIKKNPNHTGKELYNYVMMFLVSMEEKGLVVFPTHRLVRNVPGFDETAVTEQLGENFDVSKIYAYSGISEAIERKLAENADDKVFAMYTGKDYYYFLRLKSTEIAKRENIQKSEAYRLLDVTILHTLILGRFFGINAENMKNQTNLCYTRDAKEAEESVKNGDFECAFFLNPTKIREIKEISLANEKMPQKSTYFYPKLITGLIMNKFQ